MSEAGFTLNARLAQGGVEVARLALCVVLLKHDARWPWLILVPRRADLVEAHALSDADHSTLWREVRAASHAIAQEPGVAKVNIAALGNEVPQLHVHVVGRWPGDAAWPAPVFGVAGKTAYSGDALETRLARLRALL